MEILRNPTTVKLMAVQIILAGDEYIAKKLPEKQFKELIMYYAANHGKKLFALNGINPTIASRIGKKRLELVNIMLAGFQHRII